MIKIGTTIVVTNRNSAYYNRKGKVIAIYEDATQLRYLVSTTLWPGTKLSPSDNIMLISQYILEVTPTEKDELHNTGA